MTETRQRAEGGIDGNPFAIDWMVSGMLSPAATKGATRLIEAEADLLSDIDSITNRWLQRRRQDVDAARHTLAEMSDAHEPGQILRLHQEWMNGSLQRLSGDINDFCQMALSAFSRTTKRFSDTGRELGEEVSRQERAFARTGGERTERTAA
jgi:hypothetical protein